MTALQRAIDAFPSATAFASAIGAAQNSPSMWKARGNVPAEYCPAIERETRRLAAELGDPSVIVLCEELRSDIPWGVLREQVAPSDAEA